MKRVSLLLMLFILSKGVFAQKTYKDKYFGISINEPKNWIVKDNSAFIDSLIGDKVNDSLLAKEIEVNNGSLLLATFNKYDEKKSGFIPIIQINVLNNPSVLFNDFEVDMKASANLYKSLYQDFSFITQPQSVTVNGKKSIYFSGKFTLTGTRTFQVNIGGNNYEQNQTLKYLIQTKVYAIPYGNYFFQLSFTDNLDVKDDEKLFEDLLTSIRIGK
ncbi:hypothetical protein EZ428_17430 [Pedobacter frigiditerrae]|uniref:Uncharacterized protein n=1 Tax=Pedobacter frigiditerrae TaxID=2530452 RepID=A0A4R0MRW5_9SPHI|nr:hypothetical protein [Pedobacter frigiditerrae]TCC89473.1 hypothetical protein EZ428_17430 [Pedobacter frigiditerrae]